VLSKLSLAEIFGLLKTLFKNIAKLDLTLSVKSHKSKNLIISNLI